MGHHGWAISKSVGGKAKARNPLCTQMEAGAPHQPLPSGAAYNPLGRILGLYLTH